ncbi:MAG: DUF6273 domain-containing protein [Eubacteriales bacterium]|nr:DUF6273 domain-containing protein [Eubacteriales bacterium]
MHNSDSGRKKLRRFFSLLICMITVSCLFITCFVSADSDSYTIGDEFLFGHYEQDNDDRTNPKKEDIAWIVIDIDSEGDSDKLLLLSKYALDNTPYQSNGSSTTWASSQMREWLNGIFLKTAFTSDEIDMIVETTIENNPGHHFPKVDSGSITKDKLFLLSEYEASDSYITKDIRQCIATKYAQGRGTWVDCDNLCAWWLRTPGCSASNAMYVGTDGHTVDAGFNVSRLVCGVRPALWIDLGKAE